MAENAPGEEGGGGGTGKSGGGLGDILSMALFQTGVNSIAPAQISVDHSSILNAAANTLDSSLLSTDISVLTAGLLSTLARENALRNEQNKSRATGTNPQPTATVVSSGKPTPTAQSAQTPTVPPSVTNCALSLVTRPPSESEMKTAELLKAELRNSALDNDIDLDELLAGGDSMSVDSVNEMSFLTGSVGSNSTLNTAPSDPFLLPSHTTSPSLPGLCTNTAADPFSSLLNMPSTHHLGSMEPPSSAPGVSVPGSTGQNTPPAVSRSPVLTAPQSVKLTTAATSTSSSSSLSASSSSVKTTKRALPLPFPAPSLTSSTSSPAAPSLSSSPSSNTITGLNKITSTSTSTTTPSSTKKVALFTTKPGLPSAATKPALPATKLDLAAILREVTKMTPGSVSTSPLTSTVSVTIVPPSAVQTAMEGVGGGARTHRLFSLPGGVSFLAKALQRAGALKQGRPASEQQSSQPEQEDESEDEDEDWAAITTYSNYKPSKLRIGHSHPDPIVESSSLSSVEPPQVWFDLKLPPHVIEQIQLSSLQLEAVVYACQQHMNILSDGSRAGFLVGDGAGVGKGRTIAGIIYQNYLEGRKKAIWLSVSNDLKYDAIRDLKDVGAKKIEVYSLNKFYYGKISGKRNGRVRKGVIFSTYSSLIGESSSGGKYRTRLNQLLHWLGQFEGVIVFDECHKAKNLVPTGASKPSKTGLTVLQLQKRLPKARIVYCSATGASEPRNMAYMSRLGIWGPGTQFPSFHDFIKAVERRGVGAMEIVAMDMKLRGMYIARQLSFSGVTFDIREVSLTDKFIEMYDSSVEMWVDAKRLFQEAADLMDYDRKKLKTMWAQFWASHQVGASLIVVSLIVVFSAAYSMSMCVTTYLSTEVLQVPV
ncbi:Protein strawberry notch homolog 1, partial [Geodia barretti]